MTTTVAIELTFRTGTDGTEPGPANELAAALRDHLMRTFNDNESIVEVEQIVGAEGELLDDPVRACTVVDGVLTCPDGHSGDIQHQEQQWERRSVLGVVDGVLKIEGESRTLDDSGSGEVLFCRICGADCDFPADVPVDYV